MKALKSIRTFSNTMYITTHPAFSVSCEEAQNICNWYIKHLCLAQGLAILTADFIRQSYYTSDVIGKVYCQEKR